MAYTGTGAKEDPYCVSNLTDFIKCIRNANSYVKVIADIDAAADPSYTDELNGYLQISSKCVYADEQKTIKGLKVCANHFIKFTMSGILVKNLSFVDCVHQKSSYDASIDSTYDTCTFDNCKFSMKIICYSGTFSTKRIAFEKCAANLTYVSIAESSTFSGSSFQSCNFVVTDFLWTGSTYLIEGSVTKTGFIFCSLKTATSRSAFTIYGGQNRNCFVVFADINTASIGTTNATISAASSHQTSLFALQNKPENLSVNSSLTEVTPEQLKSKEYLESIGFFP